MFSFAASFEAMMSGITSPPLSLDEFRIFISHDIMAKNALAFCEWYQRYRTVYFDRIESLVEKSDAAVVNNNGLNDHTRSGYALNTKISLPAIFSNNMPTNYFSTPEICSNRESTNIVADDIILPNRHKSFSILSESLTESICNALDSTRDVEHTGMYNSGGGIRKRDTMNTALSGRVPSKQPAYSTVSSSDLGAIESNIAETRYGGVRRRTLPVALSDFTLNIEAIEQEEARQQIQSLLILECWLRFLSHDAEEKLDMPKEEYLYITERLPLNITHLPRPLLCKKDMIPLPQSQISTRFSKIKDLRTGTGAQITANSGSLNSQFQNPLHCQPFQQLRRNLKSLLYLRPQNTPQDQSSISTNFGDCAIECGTNDNKRNYRRAINLEGLKNTVASLRRVSTMPTLRQKKSIAQNSIDMPYGTIPIKLLTVRDQKLVSVDHLKKYHQSLRPRPPFMSTTSEPGKPISSYGYRPIAGSISKLVVPSSVPPALFETVAKISTNYLLNKHYPKFYQAAGKNITSSERNILAFLSFLLFCTGCSIGVALIVCKVSKAWRSFTLALMIPSVLFAVTSWKCISIIRWWQRKRPTTLIKSEGIINRLSTNEESAFHTLDQARSNINSIRIATGTYVPDPHLGLSGTVQTMYQPLLFADFHDKEPSIIENVSSSGIDGSSNFSLWSYITSNTLPVYISDLIIRTQLYRKAHGDSWTINFENKNYEVIDPSILGGQIYAVMHQIIAFLFMCIVVCLVLFMVE